MEFIYCLQFCSLCLHLAFEYFAINTEKALLPVNCELRNLIFIMVFSLWEFKEMKELWKWKNKTLWYTTTDRWKLMFLTVTVTDLFVQRFIACHITIYGCCHVCKINGI